MIWTKSKAGWGFPSWRGSPAGPLDLSSSRIIECTRDVCYLSSSSLIADISLFALTSASNTPFYPLPGMNRGWPMCSDKGFLLFWPNWPLFKLAWSFSLRPFLCINNQHIWDIHVIIYPCLWSQIIMKILKYRCGLSWSGDSQMGSFTLWSIQVSVSLL